MVSVDTSHELITTIEPGQVALNNLPIRVVGAVTYELVNLTGHKVQQGEPGPDDHPYNSTIIIRNYLGGGQCLIYRGDQDKDRYYDSNCETERLEVLALPPAITTILGPNSNQCVVLGQYPRDAFSKVIASWGGTLCRVNADLTVTTLGSFVSETPLPRKATVFAPKGSPDAPVMFIPCGASYHTWDGTTLTRQALPAIDFLIWQDKIFRLDQAGNVYYNLTGAAADWQASGSLPSGETGHRLVLFYDRNNDFAPYVTTTGPVYAVDFDDGILFETDLFYPKHPRTGLAVCTWRADLYLAGGLGVLRQSNGFIDAVGLDRDWGLPERLSGYIVDMEPAFNAYYALVAGAVTPGTGTAIGTLRLTGQETMQAPVGQTLSSLHAWNGIGWHKYWEGNGAPTTVFVSNPEGDYKLWWAAGSTLYMRPLVMDYYNPREVAPFPLALQSEHITPRYNWGWINITKIMKDWESFGGNLTAASNIQIYAKLDDPDLDWSLVGTLNGGKRATIPFGQVTWDTRVLHYGEPHEWIQFRYVFNRDPATPYTSPYLEWYSLVGRKFLKPQRIWTLQIDLANAHRDMSELDMADFLDTIAETPTAVPFVHKARLYMVEMTTLKGGDATGNDTTSLRNVTLIETTEVI